MAIEMRFFTTIGNSPYYKKREKQLKRTNCLNNQSRYDKIKDVIVVNITHHPTVKMVG